MNPLDVLTVSKVERYDPEQRGGCPRRFYFEDVEGHRPEQATGQKDGDIGHEHCARYGLTGEQPGRVKLGKAVRAAIAKGHLPTPGPDLMVESRFDGQPRRGPDGRWLRVDLARTLHFAGAPWDGFVDVRFRRGDVPEVRDYKFSSDIRENAKRPEQLIRTVQMPVYVLDSLRIWPDATRWRLVHTNISRRGEESFLSEAVVTRDQVLERAAEIAALVERMRATVAGARSQEDVPFNRRACTAWRGCPHQFRCSAYRRNAPMNLSPEELEMFGFAEEPPPAAAAPGPVSDTMNQLEADDAVAPSPVASAPAAQPAPVCNGCGVELTAENTSTLRSGERKHVGCPAAAAPAPEAPAAEAPKRRGRPPGSGKGKMAASMAAALETPPAEAPKPAPAPKPGCDGGDCGHPCTKCGAEYGGACDGGSQCPDGKRQCECPPTPAQLAETREALDATAAVTALHVPPAVIVDPPGSGERLGMMAGEELPRAPRVETAVAATACRCGSRRVGKLSGACADCGLPAASRVAPAAPAASMVSADGGKTWEPTGEVMKRIDAGREALAGRFATVERELLAILTHLAAAGQTGTAREVLSQIDWAQARRRSAADGSLA